VSVITLAMDRLRDDLLAGAGLAGDQHRERGRRDHRDLLGDVHDREALAHQVAEAAITADLLAELGDFILEREGLERAAQREQQLFVVDGFVEVVECAELVARTAVSRSRCAVSMITGVSVSVVRS